MGEIPSSDQNQKNEARKRLSKISTATAAAALLGFGVGVPVQLVRDGMFGVVATPNPFGHSTAPRLEADNPLTWIATPIDDVVIHFDSQGPNQHLNFDNGPQITSGNETTTSLPNGAVHHQTPPKGDLVIPGNPIQ